MRDFDPNDPDQYALYKAAMDALEKVWPAYLRFVQCVGCARRDIIEHTKAMANKTATEEIIGLDFLNEWSMDGKGTEDQLPVERNGITRYCESCGEEGKKFS